MTDAINPQHYKRLPAEAIEIIEAAIEGAESVPGFFQGQALKYLLRLNHKGCKTTDAKKAKWYLDRLVNLLDEREKQKAADLQSLKDHPFGKPKSVSKAEAPEATGEVTEGVAVEVKPPDGWRFLERGEVIRKGDILFENGQKQALGPMMIGQTCQKHWRPVIRRNRFEVGEKVIDCRGNVAFRVQHFDQEHLIVFVDGVSNGIESRYLAPYIEETK